MSKRDEKILTLEEEIMFLEELKFPGWVDRVAKLRKEQDDLISEITLEKLDEMNLDRFAAMPEQEF